MSVQHPLTLPGSSGTLSVAVGAPRRGHPQRVSHQLHSSHAAAVTENSATTLPDVFAHPAVIAYVANHPNRPLPKFGAYYMLQTLGEGEFGKVKLGLHFKYGDEVAVKLIRRETADNEAKMAKIAREIEILDVLKHPNIVRLYDVFETDKFFGIILEYASGGELFDHILAHRYLRERDAAKLFSQLISGVWYMHQKNIVHRDLKLENLLLDRNHNLIITDFGFANSFTRDKNDMMETMCGSPCYAAPELVNSDGLYVGTAADIWSCGVILYAMLSGYLPFDDDPTNPDGSDITKLYAYIARTPLTFPDHISDAACSLLDAMLVSNPLERAELGTVMRHAWFAMYARELTTFGLTVKELEKLAENGPTLRRLAYQRGLNSTDGAPRSPRTQKRGGSKQSVPPETSGTGSGELDPSAKPPSALKDTVGSPRKQRGVERVTNENGKDRGHKEDRFRHTIQVEPEARCGSDGRQKRQSSSRGPSDGRRTPTSLITALPVVYDDTAAAFTGGTNDVASLPGTPTKGRRRRASNSSATKPGSPNPRSRPPLAPVLASLERTAEVPSPVLTNTTDTEQYLANGGPQSHRDEGSARSPLDRPVQSNGAPVVINGGSRSRAQLAPLIIDDAPSSGSSTKQTLAQTKHPSASAVPQASPSKPNKVMQWFRRGRRSVNVNGTSSPGTSHEAAASSVEVASIPHKSAPSPSPFLVTPGTSEHRQRTTSAVSITSLFRRSAGVSGPSSGGSKAAMRIHHGAVDHEMITGRRPGEVMQHMHDVLTAMGLDIHIEGDFKYRCIRPAKRGRSDITNGVGSNAANPGVFRGLLARRQPSPARSTLMESNSSDVLPTDHPPQHSNTVYGDLVEDVGEVRFSVELTRLDRLKDMYSLDIRRLKGNLKSYKFLYDTVRTRADLQR